MNKDIKKKVEALLQDPTFGTLRHPGRPYEGRSNRKQYLPQHRRAFLDIVRDLSYADTMEVMAYDFRLPNKRLWRHWMEAAGIPTPKAPRRAPPGRKPMYSQEMKELILEETKDLVSKKLAAWAKANGVGLSSIYQWRRDAKKAAGEPTGRWPEKAAAKKVEKAPEKAAAEKVLPSRNDQILAKENRELREKLAVLEQEKESFRLRVNGMMDQVANNDAALLAEKRRCEGYIRQLKFYEDATPEDRAESKMYGKYKEAVQKLRDLEAEHKRLEKQHKSLQLTHAAFIDDFNALKKERNDLLKTDEDLRVRISNLEGRNGAAVNDLRAEVEILRERAREDSEAMRQLHKELDEAKSQASVPADAAEHSAKIARLTLEAATWKEIAKSLERLT